RHVDDAPPAPGGHRLDEPLGDLEHAAQVRLDDRVPGAPIHLAEGAIPGDPRVVDQDVDAVELVVDARAHLRHLAGPAHVEDVAVGFAPEGADLPADLLRVVTAPARTDGDVRARRGESQRRRPADAA